MRRSIWNIVLASVLLIVVGCEAQDPNTTRGERDPISNDISQIYFGGLAWFSVDLFKTQATIRSGVENHFSGHFLRAIEIECDLYLKNGQVAHTESLSVDFYDPIPPGGSSVFEKTVRLQDLKYHIDDYRRGPIEEMCRLVMAESIQRELHTNEYVSVTKIECAGLIFGKTRYLLTYSHPTVTVTSASVRCWQNQALELFGTGRWIDSGTLRRPMAPIGELLPPGSEEWLEPVRESCPSREPIICSVTADF